MTEAATVATVEDEVVAVEDQDDQKVAVVVADQDNWELVEMEDQDDREVVVVVTAAAMIMVGEEGVIAALAQPVTEVDAERSASRVLAPP